MIKLRELLHEMAVNLILTNFKINNLLSRIIKFEQKKNGKKRNGKLYTKKCATD